ncbi:UNVERIFIED_CONTAM: hypothetical protein GTU68_028652 [Idotea baltica]|nr:hypothetical protein [Idotea baltica]
MDFSWSDAHTNLKQDVIAFALEHLNEDNFENDKNEIFPRGAWKKCADFGIQKLALPLKYGGNNEKVDFLGAIHAMEGLGFACSDNGLSFGLNAVMWTVMTPILEFGSDELKEKYLIPTGNGDLIASHALTEPGAGSDVYNMETSALKTEGGYILNGEKHLITLAPICDYALVLAKTNPDLGKWGISAFIVEKGAKGFEISKKKSKMGMRSIPIGSFEFKNCFVQSENLLGKEGMGFAIINHSLEFDKCCILASQLGAMERQLESSIKYVKLRKQYGKSVGSFQSVSNRIADMKLRLETSKLLLYKTAWLKSKGKNVSLESSLLKLQLSEAFVSSSIDAIRNGGGMAYLSENEVERDLRDSLGGVIYAGTSDIQRNIIAKLLGL